jgi:hypothetical protein
MVTPDHTAFRSGRYFEDRTPSTSTECWTSLRRRAVETLALGTQILPASSANGLRTGAPELLGNSRYCDNRALRPGDAR